MGEEAEVGDKDGNLLIDDDDVSATLGPNVCSNGLQKEASLFIPNGPKINSLSFPH